MGVGDKFQLIKGAIFFILIISFREGRGQEVNFSQYNYTPFLVNPGAIGGTDEPLFIFNNKNQGGNTPSNTMNISGIMPIIKRTKNIGSAGLSLYMDKSGEPRIFKKQGASATYAHHLSLNKLSYLTFGLQLGLFQNKISTESLTSASQWNSVSGYDPNLSLGESFNASSKSYITIGSGIILNKKDESGSNKYYLGFSAFNLNRAQQNYFDKSGGSALKYVVTGGLRVYQKQSYNVTPEFIFSRTSDINYLMAGVRLKYLFIPSPLSTIKPGDLTLISRYGINHILVTGIQFNQPSFSLGISFDYPVASIAMNKGAFEIMVAIRRRKMKPKKEYKTIEHYNVGEVREFYAKEKENSSNRPAIKQDYEDLQEIPSDSISSEISMRFQLKREFKFQFNDSRIIDEGDKKFLEDILKLLQGNKLLKLEIIGHTDDVGTDKANKKVSEQRAHAVYNYLLDKGINKKRLNYTGKGASEPIISNSSEANRALNRRVEFVIYK